MKPKVPEYKYFKLRVSKKLSLFMFLLFLANITFAQDEREHQVNLMLDSWHKAAANANFNGYFDLMADDAVFIGTDATENWTKSAFQGYAKPYFDKGKAWSFTAIQRHIYFSKDLDIAWFDELLDTRMKICRGSGVLVFIDGKWKIKHYVLSMTVPNDNTDEVVRIKSPIEESLMIQLKKKKE